MSTVVMAHDYVSASQKIEKAIDRLRSSVPGDDQAFHHLVITLVDEACSGVKLYMPTGDANGKPFCFERQGIPVWALYTDQRMAEACASWCIATANEMGVPRAVEQSLMEVIDRQTVALALNMGLPSQMLIPPDVVHTVAHLCITHQLNTVEPEGSAWNEWIGIMNRYFEEQKTEEEKARKSKGFFGFLRKKEKEEESKTIHVENLELKLPIQEVNAPPALAIFLGPKPDTKYILS